MGAAALLLASACAVGPDFKPPAPPQVAGYGHDADPSRTINAAGVAQRFDEDAELPADWWHLFASPALDRAVEAALAGSPTVEVAQARLRQAQDQLRAGYGIFYPSLDADFSATREKYSPQRLGQAGPGRLFSLLTLSASVSYALDVFGGRRREVEQLGALVDQQREQLRAANLSLSANVANAVIAQAAYQAQIDATHEIISLQSEQLRLAQVRAEAGTIPYSDVLSLQSQLAATRATLPQLEQQRVHSLDLLASLSGRFPAESPAPEVSLTDLRLPEQVPLSLPSALAHHRPDILAAEATLHAASAGVGIATAALFPSVTLGAAYSAASPSAGELFATGGRGWSVGGDIAAPLFEGGTLWFQRKAAVEAYDQARASYRQTVLDAFAQVADVLRALEHDAQTVEARAQARAAAQRALQLVQINFDSGLVGGTELLLAQSQYQQARITELEALALRDQDTVALFAALGGGWAGDGRGLPGGPKTTPPAFTDRGEK
jgi:NodT family efflux transporter outer membrane factor (OMF) lipoprotein